MISSKYSNSAVWSQATPSIQCWRLALMFGEFVSSIGSRSQAPSRTWPDAERGIP